jgi:hypothetical protein
MKAWKYSRGEWTEIESPLVWLDGEEMGTALERAGYYRSASASYGYTDIGYGIEVYTKEERGPPYLLTVAVDGETYEEVWIEDFPSLLEFLRDFAPQFVQSGLEFRIGEMEKLMEKAFQAWHGHAAYSVCKQCDPLEWDEVQRLRRDKAAALKAERKGPFKIKTTDGEGSGDAQ